MCLIRKHQNIWGKNWIPRRNKKIRYYTWRRQHPSISNWQIQKTNYQFPDSTVGKESACNARDPGSIPGWGRPTGEGTGYPLQYSWASFVAQLVKNPPAMWETWVRWLDWEDPLEKGKPTTPVFWPGEFHGLYSPWRQRVGHGWATFTFKDTAELNSTNIQADLTDLIESFIQQWTTHSSQSHTEHFPKQNPEQIIQSMLSDHKWIKLETNNVNIAGKPHNSRSVHNTLLNNTWVKKIPTENFKYFELNEKNNLWKTGEMQWQQWLEKNL